MEEGRRALVLYKVEKLPLIELKDSTVDLRSTSVYGNDLTLVTLRGKPPWLGRRFAWCAC